MSDNSRYSEDARRLSGNVSAAQWIIKESGEIDRRWIAVQLYDGSTDGEIYYTKDDAIRHQKYPWHCAYLLIPPTGMSLREAEDWLAVHRRLKKANWDLESDRQYITPLTLEGISSHLARIGRK
jgi:hypothetical protein